MDEPVGAAWVMDPSGLHEHRYWNGSAWTEHVSDHGSQASDGIEPDEFPPQSETADIQPPAEVAGRGQFGDGVTAPLYEFQASRFRGGRIFSPNVIRVWPNRLEEYEHHAVLKKKTNAIHFAQVAQVTLGRGMIWADISVESSGGHTIALHGVPKADAGRVKDLIDDAVHSAKNPGLKSAQGDGASTDLVVQLRDLAALRDEGILTDDEFAAQKTRLLGS